MSDEQGKEIVAALDRILTALAFLTAFLILSGVSIVIGLSRIADKLK